jgi:hypothetical protein
MDPPAPVDVVLRAEYWYPDDGGQVWIEGYALVDGSGRFLAREDPLIAARDLHVAGVAGAARHHAAALEAASLPPGSPVRLERDRENAYDEHAIRVLADDMPVQLGWVPRQLAARIAPDLDAGRPWTALVLREQRRSPRDPRTGLTLLLSPHPVELRVQAA